MMWPMKLTVIIALLLAAVSLAGYACKSAGSEPAVNNVSAATPVGPTTPVAQTTSTPDKPPPCSIDKALAPDLNGVKIGMTRDAVLALFPGAGDDQELSSMLSRPPSKFGTSDLIIRPEKYGSKERFAGINQISFTLLDGRVFTMNVSYGGPAYSHVDEFVTKFVAGRSLPPPDQWEAFAGMDSQMKTLSCKGFYVEVFAGGEGGNLNHVLIRDLDAEKELKDRRAKAKAKASPSP